MFGTHGVEEPEGGGGMCTVLFHDSFGRSRGSPELQVCDKFAVRPPEQPVVAGARDGTESRQPIIRKWVGTDSRPNSLHETQNSQSAGFVERGDERRR